MVKDTSTENSVVWRDWLFRTRETDCKTLICVGLINLLLTPFILVFLSMYIYLFPCIYAGISSLCCRCFFGEGCCLPFCGKCLFTDKDFPPNKTSLGPVKVQEAISWKRAGHISVKDKSGKEDPKKKFSKVFEHGIEPTDIAQGQLGDCWLLSALAALAEEPATIQNCFLTGNICPH
jgi:hypothetical protein